MTQTIDIYSMIAGPEMNALVATEAMEWHIEYKINRGGKFWCVKDGGEQCFVDLFDPSEDIKDAWKVMEKLMKDRYIFTIITIDSLCFECSVELDSKTVADLDAETAPLAICKAALKSVMK